MGYTKGKGMVLLIEGVRVMEERSGIGDVEMLLESSA